MLGCIFTGCTTLPDLQQPEPQSLPITELQDTSIARALQPELAKQATGVSGFYPLIEADDAFAARMLLARHAERTLDVQ